MQMAHKKRWQAAPLFILACLVASTASADTPTTFDDFEGSPPTVTNRFRPLKNRLELSLFFTPTLVEKYLSHTGGAAALTFHAFDWLAFEALGGYVASSEVDIISGAGGIRAQESTPHDPNLPDQIGMSWFAFGNLEIAPIYGKINFLSELDFSTQIYFLGGVGAVGAVKHALVPGATDPTQTQVLGDGIKFAGDVGVGIRLFILRWLALRAEFRDIIYTDQFDYSYQGKSPTPDVIQNFMGFFGLTFILNS